MKKKDGAFVVLLRTVSNRKEVFLVKRSDRTYWELTGGGIEENEKVTEAANREVFEETGFKIIGLSRLAALYNNTAGDFCNQSYLYVGAVGVGSKYVPEYPGNKGRWFPVLWLPRVRPITAVRIQDALQFIIDGKMISRELARD